MTEKTFLTEDIVLFSEIASDIKKNPKDYQEAGKWLDDYCSKDSFRKRIEIYTKQLENDLADYHFPLEDELEVFKFMLNSSIYLSWFDIKLTEDGEIDVEATKRLIINCRNSNDLYVYTWRDTIWHFIGNRHGTPCLSHEKYKQILLMTWLLTRPDEPDAESLGLNITTFEKMAIEKKHSLYRDTFKLSEHRCQQWMEAAKQAWQIVKLPQPSGNSEEKVKYKNESPAKHSSDFRSVCWFGTCYSFTAQQAAAVKILWEAWENGTPDIGGVTLTELIGSESNHPKDIFKNNPAFNVMIQSGKTKGTFRLIEPDK